MDRLRAFLSDLKDRVQGGHAEDELREELDFHLEMEMEANLRAGMNPAEARKKAILAFGSREWHAERVREARGGGVPEDLARDIRFGLRVLRARPVFAMAAILTLSIGVGMTTAMFALVDAVVLRPLPGASGGRMVYLELESDNGRATASPTPELLRLVRDHATSFSRVEAYATRGFSMAVDGEPLRGKGAQASAGFFSFLGVKPQMGRVLLPGDREGAESPVVVLSHTFWVERFGGRRDVVGRTMVIDGRTHEIVGVLPRDFRVDIPEEALFWIPQGAAGEFFTEGVPVEGALAALADGVSLEAARAELEALVQNSPLTRMANMGWVGRVKTPEELIDPSLRRAVLLLQAGAILVLLIACGNLANLLLGQGEARARELAVRSSLGAGRGRLIRQLLAESVVLGVLGGGGGILLAAWALESLPLFLPPGYAGFSLNGRVLGFAVLVSLVGVLMAGLLPARKGSKRNLGEVMKGVRGHHGVLWGRVRAQQVLVTLEVAMSFILLVSAGLLLKSFSGLMTADVGFPRQDLLTIRLELPEEGYGDGAARLDFLHQLRDGIRGGFPRQLGSATVASGLVEDLSARIAPLVPEGAGEGEGEEQVLFTWNVAPDYFDVVGVPLIRGRGFLEGEGSGGEEVVVVSEEVARRVFPGGDAVGKRIRVREDGYRVVGVAGSVKLPSLAQSAFGDLQLFFPLQQGVTGDITIIARVRADRVAAVDHLKEAVWRVDSSLPILDVSLVEDALAESLSRERSNALLMLLFALTALTLGAIGIYGVVAYSVTRRTREIGIRLALGASARGVVGRVVLGGMRTVGAGLALGAVAAFTLGSILSELLFEVSSRDPVVFVLVAFTIVSVAGLATWLPARRAAGAGPAHSLRCE
jgi:putative ABC transport system permease protein